MIPEWIWFAARDRQRLEPFRLLIADLGSTPEGREIVPDELCAIWEIGKLMKEHKLNESELARRIDTRIKVELAAARQTGC